MRLEQIKAGRGPEGGKLLLQLGVGGEGVASSVLLCAGCALESSEELSKMMLPEPQPRPIKESTRIFKELPRWF